MLIKLREHPLLAETAAVWFHEKWGIPLEAYRDSIRQCLEGDGPVPQWYLAMEDDKIVGGMGVIANDFHPRTDLTPNVCAVYVEEKYRCRGIAGKLLNLVCEDMHGFGMDTLYLLTDHTAFYERYGWEFFCPVTDEGGEVSRMYIHRYQSA